MSQILARRLRRIERALIAFAICETGTCLPPILCRPPGVSIWDLPPVPPTRADEAEADCAAEPTPPDCPEGRAS
jgi:hypothetical protein